MTATRVKVTVGIWLLLAGLAAFLVRGIESDSRPSIFLHPDDPVRRSYDEFTGIFGTDTFVMVSCRGDLARVPELVAALEATPHVEGVYVPAKGASVTEALHLLAPDRVSLPVTIDDSFTEGLAAVRETCAGFPALAPAIAGEPALNVELQQAADAVGKRLFPLLALMMAALLFAAYRSVRVVLAALLTTVVALLLGMASIAVAGAAMNLVTILLPVLLLALTVALCVHLVNAYRLWLAAGVPVGDAVRAMRREELRPCLVTSLTTAAGFGSFALARIEPLAELGRAMAVSILLSLVVAFTLLPALLVLFRPRPREGLSIGEALVRFVPGLVPSRGVAYACLAAAVVAAVLAAPSVPRETNAIRYLPEDNGLRRETERLAAEGVGTASVELLLRPAPGGPLDDLAAPLRHIEEEARRWQENGVPHVRGVVTPVTIAREAGRVLGPAGAMLAEKLAFAPAPPPVEARVAAFRSTKDAAARASILIDPVDLHAYASLRARVDALGREAVALAPGATFELTGEFPVVMTVQDGLLGTLLWSLAGTAGTILVILALAMRSLRLAALTLLPAIVPLAFVVIACALADIPLSISTVMVLAVALGIVTDNSVHMLHAFTGGDALKGALRRVGTAITETSIAIFLGFAVCVLSEFLPTRHFGLLTASAMLVALLADLILFPSFLRARPAAAPAMAPALALESER